MLFHTGSAHLLFIPSWWRRIDKVHGRTMKHTNNLASIVCSFYCVRPKWWLWKYFSPHKQTLRFCIRIYQWPSPIVYIGIVVQNTQRMTTLVPDQTREIGILHQPRCRWSISLQKDCQRCEQKHLITKHSIFMRRMGLPSGSCCHCFCVYVTANIPFIAIHNSNGSSIWTKCVLYLCVLCVLTEIRAKIQQTCAFKWTNIYLFMCLQSWNLCSINELCPLAKCTWLSPSDPFNWTLRLR